MPDLKPIDESPIRGSARSRLVTGYTDPMSSLPTTQELFGHNQHQCFGVALLRERHFAGTDEVGMVHHPTVVIGRPISRILVRIRFGVPNFRPAQVREGLEPDVQPIASCLR